MAQKFNPNVKLVSHFANIKDAQFNVEWFSSFAIVFNALDNLEARRHVNRMCLAADVPLIESGTTGFNGQVQVIKKGKTACYDCSPKETPKSFPVCTIRSTPSQPIHCIVWAKSYLLPELFGVSEDETPELDTTSDSENAEEISKLKEEAEALKKIRGAVGSDDFARKVFDKVFTEDIERLIKMEDMWKTRKAPKALSFEQIGKEAELVEPSVSSTDQRPWTLPELFTVFKDSLARLSSRLLTETEAASKSQPDGPKPVITFDKDDVDTLDLVTAAANLRSHIFSIPPKSKFDTKQMAGNIIPAIATTNAMIGALCVMEAFKVMRGEYGRAKAIFLNRETLAAGTNDAPNPDCAVCSVTMARVKVDIKDATLDNLVTDVLKTQLGYGEEISVLNANGGVVFDPDMEDNLVKKLDELEIKEGSTIIVKDDNDEDGEEPRVDLVLIVEALKLDESSDGKDEQIKPVTLVAPAEGGLEIPRKAKKSEVAAASETNGVAETEKVNENGTATAGAITKRKREIDEVDGGDGASTPLKKVQQQGVSKASNGENGAIVLDDEEGLILIE